MTPMLLRRARLAARLARAAAEALAAAAPAATCDRMAAQIAALLAALIDSPVPGAGDAVDDDALAPLAAGIGQTLTTARAAVRAGARAAPEALLRRRCVVIARTGADALDAAARLGDALTALMDGDGASVWVAEAFDAEADLDDALRRLADAATALQAVAGADEDAGWAASAAASCSETLREWAVAAHAAAVDERVGGATAPRN